MIHPISRNQHMLTDYLYGPLIAVVPLLVGFQADATPSLICYVLGAGVLAATLMTRAELGLIRLIPFKLHLMGDALGGVFALVAPWLFGFADDHLARNTFLVIGVLNLSAAALSRPVDMPHDEMPLVGGHQPTAVLSR